jgi:hypothetical protein
MDIWQDSLDGGSARCKASTNTRQHTRTHIRASSGIRTHDPSVRAVEDNTCLRRRCNWDRLINNIKTNIRNSIWILISFFPILKFISIGFRKILSKCYLELNHVAETFPSYLRRSTAVFCYPLMRPGRFLHMNLCSRFHTTYVSLK